MTAMPSNTLCILFLCLCISLSGNAQNTIYKEVYNHNSGIRPPTPYDDNIACFYHDGTLYYAGSGSALDQSHLSIHTYHTGTGQHAALSIEKSKALKELFANRIDAIACADGKLVILNYLYIYCFSIRNGSPCVLTKMIPNEGSFNKLYGLGKHQLLLYVNYHFHPLDEPEPHSWARLYTNRDSLGAEKHMDHSNLLFSPMLNSWLSTRKGLIAYAHTADYSVRFYNEELMPVDSLISPALKSNDAKLGLLPDGSAYSLDEINRIQQADDTLLTRIEKVFLLDSTHLLLTIKQPKTHYLRYDLWNKRKDSWELYKSQSLPGHYEDKARYTKDNNSITGFYGGYCGLCYAGNNDFYYLYYPFMENPISDSFDYQRDYYEKVNELTRKNQLYYGIKKIKILTD